MLITIYADRPARVRGRHGNRVYSRVPAADACSALTCAYRASVFLQHDVVPCVRDGVLSQNGKRRRAFLGLAGSQAPMSRKAWAPARRARSPEW